MIVYVASKGEKHEGSHICGIFTTEAEAIRCCLAQEAHFDDKQWTPTKYPNDWENGCDYVCVFPHELQTEFKSE